MKLGNVLTFLGRKAVACRGSAILGGKEETEELVWTCWRQGMLSAGMRCDPKPLLDVGPLVIPMGKEENQAGLHLPWAGKRGAGPSEFFAHPLVPLLVTEFIINLINTVYRASFNLWAIAPKDTLLKDSTISAFGTRPC